MFPPGNWYWLRVPTNLTIIIGGGGAVSKDSRDINNIKRGLVALT